jgi:copper transport protein
LRITCGKNTPLSPFPIGYYFTLTSTIVLVCTILYISLAVDSYAHPFYVDSTPKPFQNIPKSTGEVSVFFSEPIEISYSDISVLGPDGKVVSKNEPHNVNGQTSSIASTLQENLPPGIYTVNTKVLSAVDGHVVDNTFTFGIETDISASNANDEGGTTSPQSQKDILSIEESASRFPGYVGQIIAFGVTFAMLWLWKPFDQVPWLSKFLLQYRSLVSNIATMILIVGSSLILASGVAMIIVQSISVDATILEIISTKFGNVWAIRMIQASALTILAVGIYRKNGQHGTQLNRTEILAVLALGFSLLITYSLIAHAAASNQLLAILADFCHSVVASIWIGGVIFLAFAAVPKLAALQLDDTIKAVVLSILIPRFSTIIVVALGVILITGPSLLWTLESDLGIVLASLYGKVLLVKLFIGLAMIVIGAFHQFISQKKFSTWVITSTRVAQTFNRNTYDASLNTMPKVGFVKNVRRFEKTLKAEAALGIGLLVMVSLMANMALPSGEFPAYERVNGRDATEVSSTSASASILENISQSREYSSTAYLDNGQKIQLTINPFAVGQNTFEISFFNSNNSISESINSLMIKLTQVERGIGPIVIEAIKQSPGRYSADAAFSLAGRWTVEILGEATEPGTPNMVAIFDVQVKPRISDLQFTVEEYKIPQQSLPLYPIYDQVRRTIWVGDSTPESGRIWEFDIETKNYTVHSISNASLITMTALGNDGQIWYLDPTKNILGKYDPVSKDNLQFTIPIEGISSAMAVDEFQNVWLTIGGQSNGIVRFSPHSNEFTLYEIPTANSLPTDITVDRQGKVWFTESVGKVGKLDPATGNITEYQPFGTNLEEPSAILSDPKDSRVYVSEHEGKAISVLDPVFDTFSKYPITSPEGLPFGMALDDYGNLWFAQHVIDKIGLIDPESNDMTEERIPTNGSFVQWLVPDDQGRIWFAEQRGSSLGAINMALQPNAVIQDEERNAGQRPSLRQGAGLATGSGPANIPQLNFGFADILGPLIAVGIIVSAALYSKNVLDLDRNIVLARQSGPKISKQ